MKWFVIWLCVAPALFALTWRTWDAAVVEAKATHKIIMVDAVRTGCHYCDDMQREVFEDANMSRWIEKRFIPVKINISHETMPLEIRVRMTPSFFFIDKEMRLLKTVPGSWNIEDFKDFCRKVTP